ncbi:MAG: hypothetical protein KA184_09975 [Candidatus Hydrogenedentes bacterium]|nr:hypothetical protein [Candidatus Hydrogenedentota bacterium]
MTAFARCHPRWFSLVFCSVAVVIPWLALESVFYVLLRIRIAGEKPGVAAWEGEGLIETDPHLGFRARPNARVHMRLAGTAGEAQECDYTIDALGRRCTPVDNAALRDRFALFFGCSFAFGEGVNDGETLPAHFARAAPAYLPYNFAFKAYGPQQMCLLAAKEDFARDVAQREGIAVYVFIDHHIDRAIGTAWVSTTWGGDLPCLTLEDGRLVHHGAFETGRPVTQACYRAFLRLPSVQYLRIDYPPVDRPENFRLVAAMIEESAGALRRCFPGLPFYVVVYPEQRMGEKLRGYVSGAGITFLNYSDLLRDAKGARRDYYGIDGHPTGNTHRIVAERLAEDVASAAP